MIDLPRWLCPPIPPPPPEAASRQVNLLDPLPKESEPGGLKAYRKSKRAEHLRRIAAMGLTEVEYFRRQKSAARRRRKGKAEKR